MEPDETTPFWDEEDLELRENGMAADGSRLVIGDVLEDGSTWRPGWPHDTETVPASTRTS